MKKSILLFLISSMFFVGACTAQVVDDNSGNSGQQIVDQQKNSQIKNNEQQKQQTDSSETNWKNYELTDLNTGTNFKVSALEGKPVLLETFAVWCPSCTRQQNELKKFHEEVGDDVVSISLNVDPNEDENKVKQHAESNGFDWRYSVAPAEMTRSLIQEFGTGIVNAPSVPVILICEDQSVRQLGSGFKSVDKLKEEISKGCNA